jgi:hypothetical protein
VGFYSIEVIWRVKGNGVYVAHDWNQGQM